MKLPVNIPRTKGEKIEKTEVPNNIVESKKINKQTNKHLLFKPLLPRLSVVAAEHIPY